MEGLKKGVTIFTPTYNRAYILPRLYKSLLQQTNLNFEWLIVDDGSSDDTKQLINFWINEKKINIRYIYQENQGKMMAHNVGTKNAKYELFVCVDSDDYLTHDAIEILIKHGVEIKNQEYCVGMVGNKRAQGEKKYVQPMTKNVKYSTLYDLYQKYNYKGETLLVYKSNIIKKFSFPQITGEKFIPEPYLYDKIDRIGELLIIRENIYIYEYLNDGYSNNAKKLMMDNPKGYILYAKQRMEFATHFKEKLRSSGQYVLGNILANEKNYIKKAPKKIFTIMSIPLACIMYLKYYKKMMRN